MKNIFIYGASGHSKMIVDILHKNQDYNIVGYIDSFKSINEQVYGYSVLGGLSDLNHLISKHNIEGIIIGIVDNYTRQKAFENISEITPNFAFISAVHPETIVSSKYVVEASSIINKSICCNELVHAMPKLAKIKRTTGAV